MIEIRKTQAFLDINKTVFYLFNTKTHKFFHRIKGRFSPYFEADDIKEAYDFDSYEQAERCLQEYVKKVVYLIDDVGYNNKNDFFKDLKDLIKNKDTFSINIKKVIVQ